jgi:hypothetical protein
VDRGLHRRASPAGPSKTAPTTPKKPHSLYNKLETAVVPLYLDAPEKWARLMRTTLAFNGSYFNTNRMVKQYTRNAYYPVRPSEIGRRGTNRMGGAALGLSKWHFQAENDGTRS